MTDANQIYGTFGGTPSEKPSLTSGARPFGVSANPNTFGAQVGEARAQEGAVYRDIGQKSMDYAMKYTGMINDTMASQKSEEYMIKLGEAEEALKSKKGLQAADYIPEYINTITKLRADLRQGMPQGAANSFDGLTRVPEGYAITNGHSYAAGQVREANYTTAKNGAMAWAYQSLHPDYATNDQAMGFVEGNIHANVNKMFMDMPGTEHNQQTGMVDFLKTPEGKVAEEEMKRELDKHIGDAQLNRFSTLTELNGVKSAYQTYLETKDRIPPATQAQLDSYFVPKVKDADARQITGSIMEDARRSYYDSIKSPEAVKQTNMKMDLTKAVFAQESTSGANAVTSDKGAVGGMQITPDTWQTWQNLGIVKPGEDINNPTDNQAAGYRALKYYSEKYGDPQRAMVAYFSGPGNVAPAGSPTPYIQDLSDGHKMTSEYVNEVTARMGGPEITRRPVTSLPTMADDFMNHYDDYQRLGQDYAEKTYPGDVEFAQKVHNYFEQHAADIIQQQKLGDTMSKKRVFQALGGMMSKDGSKPTNIQQLEDISPEVKADVDRLHMNDQYGYDAVNKHLTDNARRNNTTNSPNFYNAAIDALAPGKKFDESNVHALMDRTDGTGLNMKDYNDLTKIMEEKEKNPDWASFLQTNMQEIESANGNLDGRGKDRALNFLRMMNKAREEREIKNIPLSDMLDENNANYLGKVSGAFKPTRDQQIAFTAEHIPAMITGTLPKISSPADPELAKLPPGAHFVTPDGQVRIKK